MRGCGKPPVCRGIFIWSSKLLALPSTSTTKGVRLRTASPDRIPSGFGSVCARWRGQLGPVSPKNGVHIYLSGQK